MMKQFFGAVLVVLVLVTAGPGAAQKSGKTPRIGWLLFNSVSSNAENIDAFRRGLRELGYVEGKNISIEFRSAEAKQDRLPELAVELVRLKVEVILVGGENLIQAVRRATSDIPVVFGQVGDPVASGLIASLARPGGNITGLSSRVPGLVGKRLEILKESFPGNSRVAILWDPSLPGMVDLQRELDATAKGLGLTLQFAAILKLQGVDEAFAAIKRQRAGALLHGGFPLESLRTRLFDFVAKTRLPALYTACSSVEAGGLMCYSPDIPDQYRRAATYVDKILKGAKAAEIPVEQPKKFDFFINLKAAKQIGVTIPPNVLARADRVIR